MLACLQEKGWEVEIGRGGGVTNETTTDQIDQYEAALAECGAGATLSDGADDFSLTDEMLADGYALQLATLDCLRGEGYSDLDDPPTLQVYMDGEGSWIAYGDLPEITESEWISIQEACPQPNISLEDY